ncbi:MAG: IS4 family transposase [Ferruginibacter sp.]|nr:IS4 family transposase [Cytophagales bacterium]
MLHNPRLATEDIKQYLYADCQRQVEAGQHYLVIQDTTQPNFERNRANITHPAGLGTIGNQQQGQLGFLLHPSLVVEAQHGRCIGYSNVIHWSREAQTAGKHQRHYKQQLIEDKESYRWLQAAKESQSVLRQAGQLTIIADREGDINELFERLPDERTQRLIRSCQDRRLANESRKLYAYLGEQVLGGSFSLHIKGEQRTGRGKRVATIALRWAQVRLAPAALKGQVLTVYALEAREEHPPQGEKPIRWRLLTTHRLENADQARQVD